MDEGLTRSIGISNFSVKKIKVCAFAGKHHCLCAEPLVCHSIYSLVCCAGSEVVTAYVPTMVVQYQACLLTRQLLLPVLLIALLLLQDLLSYARIPPAVNQIEVHPYFRNQYNIDFCHSKVCLVCDAEPAWLCCCSCHLCMHTSCPALHNYSGHSPVD